MMSSFNTRPCALSSIVQWCICLSFPPPMLILKTCPENLYFEEIPVAKFGFEMCLCFSKVYLTFSFIFVCLTVSASNIPRYLCFVLIKISNFGSCIRWTSGYICVVILGGLGGGSYSRKIHFDKQQSSGEIEMVYETSFWETLGPMIHVDGTLSCTCNFNIIEDQLHIYDSRAIFP